MWIWCTQKWCPQVQRRAIFEIHFYHWTQFGLRFLFFFRSILGGGTRNIFEISLWILWKKVFRANNSCYNHVNKHKGKTFCSICKKHLSTVSNLNAHVAQKHPGFSESSLLATFRKHLEFSLEKQTIFLWYLSQVIFKQKLPSKPFGCPQGQDSLSNLQ